MAVDVTRRADTERLVAETLRHRGLARPRRAALSRGLSRSGHPRRLRLGESAWLGEVGKEGGPPDGGPPWLQGRGWRLTSLRVAVGRISDAVRPHHLVVLVREDVAVPQEESRDRKSTRLNSSHV